MKTIPLSEALKHLSRCHEVYAVEQPDTVSCVIEPELEEFLCLLTEEDDQEHFFVFTRADNPTAAVEDDILTLVACEDACNEKREVALKLLTTMQLEDTAAEVLPAPRPDEAWTLLGVAGVDSGQLLVTDPTYIGSQWQERGPTQDIAPGEFSYGGCCDATAELGYGQLRYRMGHVGAGVVFSSGLGDGGYKVYGRFEEVPGWGRRCAEVRISLLDDAELEEDQEA